MIKPDDFGRSVVFDSETKRTLQYDTVFDNGKVMSLDLRTPDLKVRLDGEIILTASEREIEVLYDLLQRAFYKIGGKA